MELLQNISVDISKHCPETLSAVGIACMAAKIKWSLMSEEEQDRFEYEVLMEKSEMDEYDRMRYEELKAKFEKEET